MKKNITRWSVISILALLIIGGWFFLNLSNERDSGREIEKQIFQLDSQGSIATDSMLPIPLVINFVTDSEGLFTTERLEKDKDRISQEMNAVWSQAGISFVLKKAEQVITTSRPGMSINQLVGDLQQLPSYQADAFNLYFVKTLYGSNGIAFASGNIILVADATTVNDFRTASHEAGHLLGLKHTSESTARLMYRGANGIGLIDEEIFLVRTRASQLSLNKLTSSFGQNSSDSADTVKYSELIFVEDAHDNRVIVLNLDGSIVKKISVGKEPHDIALSPDQQYVVTANQGDGTVSVINTKTLLVEKTFSTGKGAHGVVFSPDGAFLFVVNSQEDSLSIIAADSFLEQRKVTVSGFPEYVGTTMDGEYIFTTNLGGDGSVTILRNQGFESDILKIFNPGIDPHGWTISPDGSTIVITNLGSNFTYLLDAETFAEVSRIDTGATTEFVAFKDNSELWVTNIGSHYVSIIDTEQNEIVDTIIVGETPHGISFSFDKTRAYVPLYGPGEVVIIDVASRDIIKKIPVGQELHNSVVMRVPLIQ